MKEGSHQNTQYAQLQQCTLYRLNSSEDRLMFVGIVLPNCTGW